MFTFFQFLLLVAFLFVHASGVFALTQQEQRAEWQTELDQLNLDIAKNQAILDSTKANTATLQQAAAVLNAKIAQDKLLIKKKNIAIAQLDSDIADKNAHITSLEQQISDGHDSMAQLLRKTNQIDEYSLAEVVLANKNISDFFSDVDTFQSVNRSLQNLFAQIRAKKDLTEKEKTALQIQQNKETDIKVATQIEQKQVQANEKQQQYLISLNKTKEKTYAQVLADQQVQAAKIRAALFNLRDTSAITFGDALKFAQDASQKTGIRPAFLLAIITQESNLGANVGACVVSDLSTGDGSGKNTGTLFQQVMKAPRDTIPFQNIASRLGMDWHTTAVSCPLGVRYTPSRGYGGGMGPSQFIPSTWELFKDQVGSKLGLSGDSLDPWNPRDAFMATALYMSELGADASSYTAERNAACKYYSGSSCSSSRRPPNLSYGNSVMTIAANIQSTMIDPLNF